MNLKARVAKLEQRSGPTRRFETWIEELADAEAGGKSGYLVNMTSGERVKDGELAPAGPNVTRLMVRYTHDWRGSPDSKAGM